MEPNKSKILATVPAIRMILSGHSLKSGSFVPMEFLNEEDPDRISARLGREITILEGETEDILKSALEMKDEIGEYVLLKDLGLLGLSDNKSKIEQKLATVRKQSRGAGLPEPVGVPQFRKSLYNRIIAITGAAMGFGEGIALSLFREGANIVLLDINEKEGSRVAARLNESKSPNRAWFIRTDVTELASLQQAVYETVLEFSGLDVMISNAGVLRAGSIEEMDPDTFDFVARVNYHGYFNCVKAAVPVMQTQTRHHGSGFCDIIQINSKSGVMGSMKNFAYSGSKFGGIGLTKSFAMELMPERIKVNSICPGNFFEGPLWSDPRSGLFSQYLKTGKVPGAKTIDDVKHYYESMVPAGRGCRVEDVVKAIKYVIDQEYETGQAVMVTGGQVMLS
jgi:sorbitol-6-phosphate 2-dehydrogenase